MAISSTYGFSEATYEQVEAIKKYSGLAWVDTTKHKVLVAHNGGPYYWVSIFDRADDFPYESYLRLRLDIESEAAK